jgi:glycosyltransferase involved in cell wall biosynthesis
MSTGSGSSLVSVIIPTFNRSHLLVRAVMSVLDQTYRNIEIIIVDDGSTDDTSIVIAEIAKRANNILYVVKKNGGCASARNRGLQASNGEYVAFLDSDDQWVPDAIEALMRKLHEFEVELVYSPSIEVYPNGREEINYPVAVDRPEKLAQEHFMLTNVRNGSYLFARSALDKTGFLNEGLMYNEDSDFFQRLSIFCTAAYLPSPTIKVHHHGGGKSKNRVGIYKALLWSSQKTLAENPDFAKALGDDAGRRISQIKTQLIEALVLNGEFKEAELMAQDIFGRLDVFLRLSMYLRTGFPLKAARFILLVIQKIKKLMRRYGMPHS